MNLDLYNLIGIIVLLVLMNFAIWNTYITDEERKKDLYGSTCQGLESYVLRIKNTDTFPELSPKISLSKLTLREREVIALERIADKLTKEEKE